MKKNKAAYRKEMRRVDDLRYVENKTRKYILRMKKAMVSATAFFVVFTIAAADRGCAEMTGQPEMIVPQIRLLEEGRVSITCLAGEFSFSLGEHFNVKELAPKGFSHYN